MRSFRHLPPPLQVEIPTNAEFSTTAARRVGDAPSSSPRLPDQLRGLDRISLTFAVRGTPASDRAGAARWVPCMTAPAAVPDHVMAKLGPVLGREECADSELHFVRISLSGPSKAADESSEMGVHTVAGNAEAVAEYHIGGLASHAWESHQVLHALGYFAAEPLGERSTKLDQRVGLAPKEARGLDQLLQLRAISGGVRGGVRIAGEDHRCDQVDPLVGGLWGQGGGKGEVEGF